VENVKKDYGETATKLEFNNRIFTTVHRESFIILKDHKEEFSTNQKLRLINPTKTELGKVAMQSNDDEVPKM
jgi:hypothetical protein